MSEKQIQVDVLRTGIRILSRAIEAQATPEDKETLKLFAKGLSLLDDYDHDQLDSVGRTCKAAVLPAVESYLDLIRQMQSRFDSGIFAKKKDNSFEGAVMQIGQSFGSEEMYPSIEEKAATLLYLIVKNHPFVDGNKRIGAACFLHFLDQNDLLIQKNGQMIIGNEALAALTFL